MLPTYSFPRKVIYPCMLYMFLLFSYEHHFTKTSHVDISLVRAPHHSEIISFYLINYLLFHVPLKLFYLYRDVTIAGEGLQNLGLYSALRAFEQGGIFIVLHLLWHGTSVFSVSSERPPHSVASYDTHGNVEDLIQPGSSRVISFWYVVF
jgi:hypothetical protein